jgi:hypothetical protein
VFLDEFPPLLPIMRHIWHSSTYVITGAYSMGAITHLILNIHMHFGIVLGVVSFGSCGLLHLCSVVYLRLLIDFFSSLAVIF